MKLKSVSLSLTLNGEYYNLRCIKCFSIQNLIDFFNYNQQLLVLEYNGIILSPTCWKKTRLKNNDKIEILTLVGGG